MTLCTWAGFADNATESALCASWAQAWGSVVAILAAVLVAYVQHRQNLKAQERAAREADARALAAHVAIAQRLAADLLGIFDIVQLQSEEVPLSFAADVVNAGKGIERARTDLQLFDTLPVHVLPSYDAIHFVRELSFRFSRGIELLSALQGFQRIRPRETASFPTATHAEAEELMEAIDDEVKELWQLMRPAASRSKAQPRLGCAQAITGDAHPARKNVGQ